MKSKIELIIVIDGKFWYKNGKPYRDDGPALRFNDGECQWFDQFGCYMTNHPEEKDEDD